jgi:prevent-host-death family protein
VDISFGEVYTYKENKKGEERMEISVKEARAKFSSLLNQVKEGDEVIIRRRGKEIARLVPSNREGRRLPSLSDFRRSIRLKGEPLSTTIRKGRKEERY